MPASHILGSRLGHSRQVRRRVRRYPRVPSAGRVLAGKTVRVVAAYLRHRITHFQILLQVLAQSDVDLGLWHLRQLVLLQDLPVITIAS